MRIATWNLNRCRSGKSVRASRLLGEMSKLDADVWVLTETHQDFSPGLDYRLVARSADAPDREAARGECWVALWSRLSAEPVQMTIDLERVAAARVGKLSVVGTVLPWLSDKRDPNLMGEAAFTARLNDQALDWQRLLSMGSLCVAGDFNQDLLLSGHYYGSASGRIALRSKLSSLGLQCLTGDVDDPLADESERACIDHICIGGLPLPTKPRSSVWPPPGELSRRLSDHYCSYVTLDIE